MKKFKTITIALALTLIVMGNPEAFAQNSGRRNFEDRRQHNQRTDEGMGMRRGQHREMGRREDQQGPRQGREGQRVQAREMFGVQLFEALRQLELTPEQMEKVHEILRSGAESRRETMQENADQIRQLRKMMAQARRDWDRDAYEKAQSELEQLMGSRESQLDGTLDKLGEVLSNEQIKELKKIMSPSGAFKRMLEAVNALELRNEQSSQIKKIAKTARQQAKETQNESDKGKIYRDAGREIMELLDEDQKRQLHTETVEKVRRHQRLMELFKGLELTEQQRKEIQEIVEEEGSELKDAAPQHRRQQAGELHQKITKRIIDEVLTDEQAEKFIQRLKQLPQPNQTRQGRGERPEQGRRRGNNRERHME